jgi:aquaporin NIP
MEILESLHQNVIEYPNLSRLSAESFGTFCLVFAGTGAIVINDQTAGEISHLGIGITFGLIVLAMIYALGEVSGAHLNPAVTLSFWAAKRLKSRYVMPYVLSQVGGALAGSFLLRLLFPAHRTLGSTLPAGPAAQSFLLEIILTWILMLVILCVSTGSRERGITAGIAVGAVVGLEAIFAGPVSGASMNPARSLAPAIVSGDLRYVWLYTAAPILGALLAVFSCRLTLLCQSRRLNSCDDPPPLPYVK